MAPSGTVALKSFQSFMVSDSLLQRVVEAVKAGEKEARSTGDIQTFEVFYKGFRQNISTGRIMVIPAKVADSRETFPIALLYGCLVRQFGGEEMADILNYKIGDTEFDEYSKADLAAIKDKVFKNKEGKYESLVMFAPSWHNKREYIAFKFTKDDEQLTNMVRHLVFNVYFDPALSSAFNALMTDVATDKMDVCNVTPKLNFPGIAENPLKDYPDMQKLGAGRKKIFLTKKTAAAIEQSILEPAEMDVIAALNTAVEKSLGKKAGDMKQCRKCKETNVPDARVASLCDKCLKEIRESEKKDKKACGEMPVVEVPNVGPGTVSAEKGLPEKATEDLGPRDRQEPIGIELNPDTTPKVVAGEGKEAAKKTADYPCPSCYVPGAEGRDRWIKIRPEGSGYLPCPNCNYDPNKKPSKTAAPDAAVAPAPQKEEVVLYNQQGGSDKEYRVIMTPAGNDTWTVEAFNGPRGKATHKAQSFGPLRQDQAKKKFEELIAAKTSGGYTRSLEEQPKAPGSDALQPLPARGQGSVIQLENPIQVALYNGMLIGQMSDGMWENSSPMNHWRPMAEADVRIGKPGMNFSPRRTYSFVTLIPYVGEEMLDLARATKAYPSADLADLNHAIPYVVEARTEDFKEDWQKKYVEEILKATGETDIEQFRAKVKGQPYGMGELRKDLRAIQNVVNGQYHKDNDMRLSSIKKEGKDRNETMEYKGHSFKLTTWQERDRLNISLTDECCGGATVLDLWDDDARGLVEDGFIDPRNMIQSAVDYADSLGLITSQPDEDQHQFEASSEKSRQTAAKHEAMLQKNYGERRKVAEEVPSANSVLDEVLTDMGQAPEVKLPGQDNTNTEPERPVTTQAEPTTAPTPEPTDKPEETKAETKPEDQFFEKQQSESVTKEAAEHWNWEEGRTAAVPKQTVVYRKKKKGSTAQKVADVMDLLEGMGHFGIGSRYGAAVAEDMAGAKSEVDFDKAEVSGDARSEETTAPIKLEQHVGAEKMAAQPLPQKGTPEWHELKIALDSFKMNPAMLGVMGGTTIERAAQTLARYGLKWDETKNKAVKAAPASHLHEQASDKTSATYTEEGILPSDTSEGGKAHYFGESQELPTRKQVECMDCRHVGPPNRFGRCEKCQSGAITEKIHLDKSPSSEAKMVGASTKKSDDQRKDDVPVTPEGKPSEDKKQPVSDLADGPPEAHDVPPPVDNKVADLDPMPTEWNDPGADWEVVVDNIGTVYRGFDELEAQDAYDNYVDQSLSGVGSVGGSVTMMHNGEPVQEHSESTVEEEVDPLANMPGYREHSNSMDAQMQALNMEDQENLGEPEGDILGEF